MRRIIPGISTLIILAVVISAMIVPVSADISPTSVAGTLEPGESLYETKTVTTPEIPIMPDVYFLADTTGSMTPVIDAVKTGAATIMADISTLDSTAQYGAGNYKDYPNDAYAYQHQQNITSNTALVQTAVNTWVATGGSDGPEGQLFALDRIANGSIGWRPGSSKIVVWFGDAPAHDPVPMAATGLGYDITEATVTADLVAAGITVIAISTTTGYTNGLDDDPLLGGGDYAFAYGIIEAGAPGQASRIAAATGGSHLPGIDPGAIVAAIVTGLGTIDIYDLHLEASAGYAGWISSSPANYPVVATPANVTFDLTITVPDGTAPGLYEFTVSAVDGAGANYGTQDVAITVPEPPPIKSAPSMTIWGAGAAVLALGALLVLRQRRKMASTI